MPITQSAKKANRQNARRKTRNEEKKRDLSRAVKEYKKLVAAKKMDEAKAYLAQVYARADKTAKAGVIKKNRAARIKSRLARLLQ
ncbi:MAG: 30S ribosomal protein S20 [Candidatus Liptonbacteria bacterium RIFCSPLOWO2_01_FULL_53_13]|uniref:Small ribosomal subunit protein bS20 n=1 Tax=Candidatus Liptonbacteria bacterium RIFCSPLOWO2_01_FULL_53_13 TaxID=1798651 RepID=A0A1G2CLC8_9BACT|nr:MAG: 30S ribosomal protein S20 [Candidatus Liptonbacteria bacterium RIFCSPLOWO2_01_FULL_53_13]